jgi:hypothetical protein
MVVLSIISRDYYHNLQFLSFPDFPAVPAFPAFPAFHAFHAFPAFPRPVPVPHNDGYTPYDPSIYGNYCDCDSPVDRNLPDCTGDLLHPPLLGGVSGGETSSPAINRSTYRMWYNACIDWSTSRRSRSI